MELKHTEVVGAKCTVEDRGEAPVHSPALLSGQCFPGVWHVALKCVTRGCRPMMFKVGILHTMRPVRDVRALEGSALRWSSLQEPATLGEEDEEPATLEEEDEEGQKDSVHQHKEVSKP